MDTEERAIQLSKNAILRSEREALNMDQDTKKVKGERDRFEEEVQKMKSHMEPNSMSLSDVMKKLQLEDPVAFRDVMSDLEFQGKEPAWVQEGFAEALGQVEANGAALNPNDMQSLQAHRTRLVEEKAKLATELNRI